ncbi:hypothetical protein H2203_008653, partial [Taxawa tesnikishii (nom. ined.)]
MQPRRKGCESTIENLRPRCSSSTASLQTRGIRVATLSTFARQLKQSEAKNPTFVFSTSNLLHSRALWGQKDAQGNIHLATVRPYEREYELSHATVRGLEMVALARPASVLDLAIIGCRGIGTPYNAIKDA